MARNPKPTNQFGPRFLVAASVLIASFALDGPAREAKGFVVKAIPMWLLRSLAHGGDLVTLAAVVAVLFVCGLIARRSRVTRAAVVLASTLAATGVVVVWLKWLASRGPDGVFYGFGTGEGGIMFPSGHTAMAFAASAVIGVVWQKARWPAYVIAGAVAMSRATLFHFVSDVVAGALIGLLVGRLVTRSAAKKAFLTLDPRPHAAPAPNPDRAPPEQ